jgi:hypothetical protein
MNAKLATKQRPLLDTFEDIFIDEMSFKMNYTITLSILNKQKTKILPGSFE